MVDYNVLDGDQNEKDHGARWFVLDEEPDVGHPQHQHRDDGYSKERVSRSSEVSRGEVPRHAGTAHSDDGERAVVLETEVRVVLKRGIEGRGEPDERGVDHDRSDRRHRRDHRDARAGRRPARRAR